MTNFIVLILDLFNGLLTTLLRPIDSIIESFVPSFADISSNVSNLFNYFYNTFLFIINWLHIPPQVIALIIGYITFRVALFFGSLGIKLCLKWYHLLKS